MKRNILIMAMFILLATACSSAPSSIEPLNPDEMNNWIAYRVINRTGLYASIDPKDISQDALRFLEVGEFPKPVENTYDLMCKNITIDKVVMEICPVEVIETEETGWVLRKWIDRK